ncbi:MAG: nucleotide exchange factor GrpE [Candidatus Pacearchaeota archaeon]|jgi:molecular chaperone GrpE
MEEEKQESINNQEDNSKNSELVVETPQTVSLERFQRLQAEFDNFRKRIQKEKLENEVNSNANLISELLNILDNFELSLKHNNDPGVSLIYEELNKILEKQGLKVISTKGNFDPKLHEAMLTVNGEKEGIIIEEIQKGYILNNKLLRASKVKVSKVNKNE